MQEGFKTCSNPVHEKMEKKYKDVGTAAFTLTEQLQRAKALYPQDSLTTDTQSTHLNNEGDNGNDIEKSTNSAENE